MVNSASFAGNLTVSGSLEAYLQSISQIPILTQQQEKDLAVDYYENGNLAAARKLTLSYLRFVAHIARSYSGYGLPQADLIQEGNMGLMQAVKRFNPYKEVRLGSFAVHWIKSAIHEYVLKNFRMVKVATTKAQRKLFFNLRKHKDSINTLTKDEVDALALQLNVSADDVKTMEERLSSVDCAFDLPDAGDATADTNFSPANYLEDTRFSPEIVAEREQEEQKVSAGLRAALSRLDERSRDIINSRWFIEKKATLDELAARYEVSAERIRQIESKAFATIKAHMV